MAPSLMSCRAKIYAGHSPEKVVAQSDCLADDVDPLPVWLSTESPTKLHVSFMTDFTTAYVTPQVDYVQNSPVPLGITLATFFVQYPDGRRESKFLSCYSCGKT